MLVMEVKVHLLPLPMVIRISKDNHSLLFVNLAHIRFLTSHNRNSQGGFHPNPRSIIKSKISIKNSKLDNRLDISLKMEAMK